MTPAIVSIKNLTKRYGATSAVDGFSLDIPEGELVTLLGPSGCGKTTLLRILAGFIEASEGTIEIGGQDMRGIPPHRRPVNMVFQKYALFPHLDVHQNISFGLRLRNIPSETINEKVGRALELVRLKGFEHRRPAQLSGGEAQRVALARALVMEPKVLLLDEPLGALDLKVRQQLEMELRRIHMELGTTFVYVTHDQSEAMMVSDRVAIMNHGHLIQVGTPEEVYYAPNSIFCASFVGESNILRARARGSQAGSSEVMVGETPIRGRLNLGATEGREVSLLIRPEVISLTRDVRQRDNELQGEIQDVTFLGSSVLYRVDVGWEKPLQVLQTGRNEPGMPKRGEVVAVGWAINDTLILLD